MYSTNVRRPPGCHSDGPPKPHIAAVLAGAKIVLKKILTKNVRLLTGLFAAFPAF